MDNVYIFHLDEISYSFLPIHPDRISDGKARQLFDDLNGNVTYLREKFIYRIPFPNNKGYFIVECPTRLDFDRLSMLEALSAHIALVVESYKESRILLDQVKSLSTVTLINNLISMEDNFETNLGNLLEKIKNGFNASKGGVMLYNEKDDTLVLQKPGFGADDSAIDAYKVSVKEPSNAANVFRTGTPLLSNDCASDPRIVHKFSELYEVKNIITVPLKTEGKNIGVLHLANKTDGLWTENDLKMLQMMAAYLGNTIEKTFLLEQLKKSHDEIQKLYQIKHNMVVELSKHKETIDKQNTALESVLSTHNKLIQCLLNEGGIYEITEILSSQIGKSVIILNSFSQIIKQCLIDNEHNSIVKNYLLGTKKNFSKTISVKFNNKKLFVTPFPINLNKYHMNLFYVLIISNKYLEPHEINVIRQASTIFALEVIRQQNILQTEKKIKADFLEDLLFSKNINEKNLITRASYLNFNFTSTNILILVDIDNFSGYIEKRKITEENIFLIKKQIVLIVENIIKDYFPQSGFFVTEKSDTVLILLNYPKSDLCPELEHFAAQVREDITLKLKPMTVSVGISNLCQKVDDYRDNYLATKKVLEVSNCLKQTNCTVFQNQLGINDIFYDLLHQDKIRDFSLKLLQPLITYDERKNTNLLETAEIYLKNLNYHLTAKIMYSHVNTIRYRINKIQELLNIDFALEEDRFKLSLALNIYKFT